LQLGVILWQLAETSAVIKVTACQSVVTALQYSEKDGNKDMNISFQIGLN